ncbi:MAG: single-stranded-DNA-specific exonuclease RecJ [Rickettsiales bacterium]
MDVLDIDSSILKSVKNKKWRQKPVDPALLDALSRNSAIPNSIVELLATRKIPLEEADYYISPKIKNYLPDPYHLLDMDKAVNFTVDALQKKKKIAVFGDYDVDGATSAATLKKFFKELGHDILIYIPDRIKEGYGPNIEALKYLKEQGAEVVFTVDCGAVSYDALAEAKKIGLDVIVIDHHIGGEVLPESVAVINPNRIDEKSEYGYLCAAGVVFLFVVALNQKLKKANLDSVENKKILSLLDLTALGTVCDVVPLKGLNRAFVSQGIKIIEQATNTGIRALKQIAGIDDNIDAYHLGFVLGPRINAGGRVGDASLGANMLSTDNFEEAIQAARALDMHNHERKAIELNIINQAIQEAAEDRTSNIAFVVGHRWHLGVIGIVAGRLKETFNKPSIVITVTDGTGKASCRSVPGIDIGSVIHSAKEKGLLIAGGGHAMAAGFTVDSHKIDDLKDFIRAEIADDYNKFVAEDCEYFDQIISHGIINLNFVSEMIQMGPFGSNNPQPKFYLKNVNISNAKIVGGDHISCFVSDGNDSKSKFIKAICFRAINSPVGEILLRNQKNLNIIAQLNINHWNGNSSAEMNIQDILLD